LHCSAQERSVTGRLVGTFFTLAICTASVAIHADPVAVRYAEGVSHGFLHLRSSSGTLLADGETTQVRRGNRITSRLMFRFRDGSRYDETTVFAEQRQFRLLTEHVIQRGPSFPQPTDMFIDARSGQVTVKYTDKGEPKVESKHMDLPPDLANGIVQTLLKNVRPGDMPASFSYVAATPKPELVKLAISVAGRTRFASGRLARTAIDYVVKVDIGGLKGVLASALGKQPPDSHVWILDGDIPTFVRAEQPFFADGPLWTIEVASPRFNDHTEPETPTH
jgi:hypothetical protein